MSKIKENTRLSPTSRRWDNSHGTYLAGQAAIDGADTTAIEMEQFWGAGRLRLLVDTTLREKFDRQRYKFQAAIHHGDLDTVLDEARRMTTAWRALDQAARAAGHAALNPAVWETVLADGTVVALVRNPEDARAVVREGRQVVVYTLEELALLIGNYRAVVDVKEAFPGAKVTAIRQTVADPLDRIRDGVSLEDTFDEVNPGV